MPATPLYTLTVHANGMVIFHLDPATYDKALREEQLESKRQKALYTLHLASELLPETQPIENGIYLGEDICTVYESGQPPKVVAFPGLIKLLGENPQGRLEDAAFKDYVLSKVIGGRSLTIQKHIQAYKQANPLKPRVAFKHSGSMDSENFTIQPIVEDLNINLYIRYLDGQYRDEQFRVVSKASVEPSKELYKYTATQENDQITLRLDAPEDNSVTRDALNKLKRYAAHLLPLVKDLKNPMLWPRIEIQGEGAKTLFQNQYYNYRLEKQDRFFIFFVASLTACTTLLVIGLIATSVPLLIALGIGCGALGAGLSYVFWRIRENDKIEELNFRDRLGHELHLMSELPSKDVHKAKLGSIYLDKEGAYFLRNTSNSLNYDKIENDKIPQTTWKALLNGKSLKSQLNNPEFKKAVLEITTLAGYTAANAYEKDLARECANYLKELKSKSVTQTSRPISVADEPSNANAAVQNAANTEPLGNLPLVQNTENNNRFKKS